MAFEAALDELDSIVNELESGDIALEDALKKNLSVALRWLVTASKN